jgi:enoyl-CoA hydratase/carnithine racemase
MSLERDGPIGALTLLRPDRENAIGGRSSTFTPDFSAVGLTPDTALSFYLPRVVGRRRAVELLLTNRSLMSR